MYQCHIGSCTPKAHFNGIKKKKRNFEGLFSGREMQQGDVTGAQRHYIKVTSFVSGFP